MTHNEIVKLLQIAAAYDNRTANEGAVHAWTDASVRERWTYQDAAEAIKAHYAESTTYLMPGHVTQRIKSVRQDAAMRAPIDMPDPIGQARLKQLISGCFRAIGESDEARAERRTKAGAMKELPGGTS